MPAPNRIHSRPGFLTALLFALWWLAAPALGLWALYLTVMQPFSPLLPVLRPGAIVALTALIIWVRCRRNRGLLAAATAVLLVLMPGALLAVHLMLMPHPGIAYPVVLSVILLFESFFRTGGAS